MPWKKIEIGKTKMKITTFQAHNGNCDEEEEHNVDIDYNNGNKVSDDSEKREKTWSEIL